VAATLSGSASTTGVPIGGQVSWISAGMNADVQSWIDAPGDNHGWRISSSTEGLAFPSEQRFYSTESGLSAPNLAISYVCKPGFVALGNDCTTCTAAANADCALAQGNSCDDSGPPSTTYTCTCANPAYVPGIAGDGNPACLVPTATPTVTPSLTPTPAATATPHGIAKADLLETTVSNPPATASRSSSFTVVDTVTNLGNAPVGASITQYYLSRDATDRGRDQLLLGQRLVPALAPLAESLGAATVTVSNKTRPGSYFLLVCADDRHDVQEDDERNNCITSTGMVTVTP